MNEGVAVTDWVTRCLVEVVCKGSPKRVYVDVDPGLCGGANWSKLEFTGLETHNVSRLLITIGIFIDYSLHTKNILFLCSYL